MPPTAHGREIVEIACLDVIIQGTSVTLGEPRSWLFRPAAFVMPPADMVAGLTVADLPPCGSSCTHEHLNAILWDGEKPDVFVAHGAPQLRVMLPANVARAPWVCTHKNAVQLWPGAGGYTLDELMHWRGAKDDPDGLSTDNAYSRATPTVRRVAAVLLALLRSATLNQLLLFSQVVCRPLGPPPLPSDAAAWAWLCDHDLHWFVSQTLGLPTEVRQRAQQEKARRAKAGRPLNLRFDPPTLPM